MSTFDKFNFGENILSSEKIKSRPSDYIIDSALYNAVKVAVMLKQPLLLTGDAGTGKTRLAEKLAADLYNQYPEEYLSKPLIFHTKTISSYTDLFYIYDALGHFHDAHLNMKGEPDTSPKASDYIQLQALGQAIVLSNENYNKESFPYRFMDEIKVKRTFENGARSSVVLIDEVDKAPRDFTNDLLNELDRYEFFVKEDSNKCYRKGIKNIFIILTSNSEKNLPDAFLRRCVFYHIKPPKGSQLQKIVINQIFSHEPEYEKNKETIDELLSEYISHFETIRKESIDKQPATAELISWIYYLRREILNGNRVSKLTDEVLNPSYSILAKSKNDLGRLVENHK